MAHGPQLNDLIDHTLLRPDANSAELKQLCFDAREYSFLTVCVNPRWLPFVVRELSGTQVLPITVVGFPLGASTSKSKAFETSNAIELGAQEIDMVIDLGALKSGDWAAVELDIRSVVAAAQKKPVKVILETCLLTDAEIVSACKACVNAGAQFVKTSTGFSKSGATAHHIQLMRKTVGDSFGVKASGGVRTLEAALEMIDAGANRIGSSASVQMIQDWKKRG